MVLLPLAKLIVSPSLTLSPAPPFTAKFKPLSAVACAVSAKPLTVLIAPSIVLDVVPPMLFALRLPLGLTVVLLPNISATSFNWLPLIASVLASLTVPAATPVTFLLPALIPVVLLITTSPTVTVSNATSFAVATVTLLPACSTAMLSPATNVTVSSGLICSTELPATTPVPALSVVSFQPFFAVASTACN